MTALVRLPPERLGVAAGIGLAAGAAWLALALSMAARPGETLAEICLAVGTGSTGPFQLWAMWVLMAAAMMLPTAAPALDLYARLARRAPGPLATIPAFGAGYLAIWTTAALPMAMLHAALGQRAGALPPDAVAGAVLLLAGLYQLTPLKTACLTRCRAPLPVFLAHWREGAGGAFRLGLRHGADCLGCCWALMLLMLAGGMMNLLAMAALGLAMAAEKAVPGGPALGRRAGQAMALAGTVLIAGTAL